MSPIENARIYADTKIALLRRAIERSERPARLMFDMAGLLAERGELDESARIFQSAYRLSTTDHGLLDISQDDARTSRNRAQALVDRGVNYSAVLAALAVGSAMLGDRATVEYLVDYERLFNVTSAVRPSGMFGSDFFTALAAEIKSNLKFCDTPRFAIRKAWRHNRILKSGGPACRALAAEIELHVNRYMANLPADASHPFVASRPVEFGIEAWAVVSAGESHHVPHIHSRAWASGVYYVVCPELAREANSGRGWLRVGPPPEHRISGASGWQTRMVAPEPGTLVLMPGYFFHDTSPMGVDQERICIAFDVTPREFCPPAGLDDY
jgi:hypothetical protein